MHVACSRGCLEAVIWAAAAVLDCLHAFAESLAVLKAPLLDLPETWSLPGEETDF